MKRYSLLSICLTVLLTAGMLSGCSLLQSEDEIQTITVAHSKETIDYDMDMVRRGDVLSTQTISCSYSQLNQEYVYFPVDGVKIKKVYVDTGDTVEKGELLAELETGDLDDNIQNLEYTLAKYQLEYKQLLENKQFDLDCAQEMYYYTYMTSDDRENTEKEKADIEESYKNGIEDYQDKIYIATQQLNEYQAEKTQACVYAGMSGLISYVRTGLEGSLSNTENEIILIADDSQCSFFSEDVTYKDYITEGEEFTIDLGYGTAKQTGLAVRAVHVDQWTDKMQFDLIDDTNVVDFNTRGTINLVLGGKTDILYIPADALHEADDQYYVYTIDDDGMRQVKYISIGLIGNDSVEVTSGLEEGEIVILR